MRFEGCGRAWGGLGMLVIKTKAQLCIQLQVSICSRPSMCSSRLGPKSKYGVVPATRLCIMLPAASASVAKTFYAF